MIDKSRYSILYLTLRDFPRRVANRVQTMKMAEALAHVSNLSLTVSKLHIPKESLFNYYGILNGFDIRELGEPRFGPFTLMLFPTILRLIYSRRPDYIFIREEYPAWILSKLFNNIIFEMHDLNIKKLWLYRSIVKNSCTTVVITSALLDKCEFNGVPTKNIQVLPDGVDLSLFGCEKSKSEARSTLGLPAKKRLVIYSGRLSEWKGIYTLIESMHHIDDSVSVVLVGGFEGEKEVVESFVEKCGLRARVIFCGHQEHKTIPIFLKAADILALPNSGKTEISRYYTSPLKMFEYMASDRPIIASDLPSIREVLNEENAVLVEPDSPAKLAAGIKYILDFPHESSVRTNNALNGVKNFSWAARAMTLVSSLPKSKYSNITL